MRVVLVPGCGTDAASRDGEHRCELRHIREHANVPAPDLAGRAAVVIQQGHVRTGQAAEREQLIREELADNHRDLAPIAIEAGHVGVERAFRLTVQHRHRLMGPVHPLQQARRIASVSRRYRCSSSLRASRPRACSSRCASVPSNGPADDDSSSRSRGCSCRVLVTVRHARRQAGELVPRAFEQRIERLLEALHLLLPLALVLLREAVVAEIAEIASTCRPAGR